jgi:hypothetical protein|tara:strand:+ start:533 stop:925 length:393 start_codon:yes stop_codon:yes gene_type:complete
MNKKRSMKIKVFNDENGMNEERGDVWDDIYGKNDLDRLVRGVTEQLEDEGIIRELPMNEIEVDCNDEEIYKRSKIINKLNTEIMKRKEAIMKLDKIMKGKECNKPSTQELFGYCDDLIRVSKGKGKEKGK